MDRKDDTRKESIARNNAICHHFENTLPNRTTARDEWLLREDWSTEEDVIQSSDPAIPEVDINDYSVFTPSSFVGVATPHPYNLRTAPRGQEEDPWLFSSDAASMESMDLSLAEQFDNLKNQVSIDCGPNSNPLNFTASAKEQTAEPMTESGEKWLFGYDPDIEKFVEKYNRKYNEIPPYTSREFNELVSDEDHHGNRDSCGSISKKEEEVKKREALAESELTTSQTE